MAKNEKFNLIKTNIKESTLVNPLINTDIKILKRIITKQDLVMNYTNLCLVQEMRHQLTIPKLLVLIITLRD